MDNTELFLQEYEQLMGAGITASLIASIVPMLFSLATYIFMGIALYTIAKRRNIYHRWTAWVPIADAWMIGCISDQYRAVTMGQQRKRRKLLVWLQASWTVVYLLVAALSAYILISMWDVLMDPTYLENLNTMDEQAALELLEQIFLPMMGLLFLCLPLLALEVLYLVFFYLALSDIFKSCDLCNATTYLVLSIAAGFGASLFFGLPLMILPAIFLFALRHKDFGIPLRCTNQHIQLPQNPQMP